MDEHKTYQLETIILEELDVILDGIYAHNIIDNSNGTIVYVAIGSACNPLKKSSTWYVSPELEQQYPPFLKSLKKIVPSNQLYIFLIDPCLENTPFVVCNEHNIMDSKYVVEYGSQITTYYNETTNTYVYALKQLITYPCDTYPTMNSTNISSFLDKLNILSIDNNWFTVFQDYSGRDINKIATYYDKQLEGHLNHVVYGIGSRIDVGCSIDLTEPYCDFVYNITNNRVTAFNPHHHKKLDEINEFITKLECEHAETKSPETEKNIIIVKSQFKNFIDVKKKFISSDILTIMRQVKLLLLNKNVYNISEWNTSYISSKYNIDINKMVVGKHYEQILKCMFKILSIELTNLLSLSCGHETNEIVENIVNSIKDVDDPYKWNDSIKFALNLCSID